MTAEYAQPHSPYPQLTLRGPNGPSFVLGKAPSRDWTVTLMPAGRL